ncbi:MAG: ammonium transporter [Sulfurovaceae bacterium]
MDNAYIIDTLFALFAMTLIIFMVPGFAMLEAGLVRTKNVTSVLTVNVMIYVIASTAFITIGYNLAFGDSNFTSFSPWAFMMFQMAFVGKAINIMSGGVGERAKLLPLTIFTLIMGALIYPSVVNVNWGSDWIKDTMFDLHMVDLAGSTVIHSTGGWALLAAILILWFGFNGGSVGTIATKEAADSVAKTIFNTNTAGLLGALAAGIAIYIRYRLFDITMILNGALGGLVAVTAGPHLYSTTDAMIVGAVGGVLVVLAVPMFDKIRIDDPVGALSVHLINGIWGTLAVGIFASDPTKGITLFEQIKGIVTVGIFVFTISFIAIYIINLFIKFRATDDEQLEGLDVNECGVESYPEFRTNL